MGGKVVRQGALGYLPQEPRPEGSGVDATGLSHVLSGRDLDEAARRLEKLRLALEEDPSERNVGRFTRAEDAFRSAGGYAAEAEVRRLSQPAWASAPTAWTSPSGCSPAGNAAASSWPASSSPAATCSSSTSPPTTWIPMPSSG